MHVADMTLAPSNYALPYNPGWQPPKRYYRHHAREARAFFLGMIAADPTMSAEDKEGYYNWIEDADWEKFLKNLFLSAGWKKRTERVEDPIWASLSGINGEYERLFRCFKDGHRLTEMGVL